MKKGIRIDLVKMAMYILKRCWLVIMCMIIGAGFMYWNTNRNYVDTYTASGTMYVNNSNPNLINYQYASSSDLTSAVMLIDTYAVVVRSNRVMDKVVERLTPQYPGITAEYISSTLSMAGVGETGVVRVSCTTVNPQMSYDICNEVLNVAPAAIQEVVGAGSTNVIDFASMPLGPNGRGILRKAVIGALAGAILACGLLAILFLMNRRIDSSEELTENYTPPVLAEVSRDKRQSEDPGAFLLDQESNMVDLEAYAKLRMNLFYTLVGKKNAAVMVTSAISGEGKSTIVANLAISCAMSGKKVLLIDADMRRACQRDVFKYDTKDQMGLSDVLAGNCSWKNAIIPDIRKSLDVLPAGHQPPNPTELLESGVMQNLLRKLEDVYDLVLLDSPPINIVADPLALSGMVAGTLFVVRQGFSDHSEVRKAFVTAEMTGMNILGFIFYGENLKQGKYYNRKYYKNYYHKYDTREQPDTEKNQSPDERRNNANEADDEADSYFAGSVAIGGNGRSGRRGIK
ncbi:MAG: polysaccharide biosynthesis tyrosine autokinase [Clostridiales bacterium]|nr:polysaccharide biosynthesis tyrosine autokinase [Clostridiales bacterium]